MQPIIYHYKIRTANFKSPNQSHIIETLKQQVKITKKNADIGARTYRFKPGDAVYLLDKRKKSKQKLLPVWVGPALVLKVLSPYNIQIQLKNAREYKIVNQDHLKICLDRNLPRWILKGQESILENIPRGYCICNRPDDGLLMLNCSECLDWFHCACLNLTKQKAKSLKIFICPKCTN